MTPPTAQEAACSYLRRGWAVIPVPYRSKNPGFAGWQDLRPTEDDLPRLFPGAPQNIGVLLGAPSAGMVDVDLDSPEACALADTFLPPTRCVFGRASSPRAHRFYLPDEPILTTKYRDPTKAKDDIGAMLVEVRATGAQTLVPPSVHPSGEPVTWVEDGEPAPVVATDLVAAVARLAAAALLVRHWPCAGSRQDAALALAGGLLRAGWTVDDTAAFVETVAAAAGDEEAGKRGEAAHFTDRALANGDPATGWPTLAELLAPAVVDRVRSWLGISGDGRSRTGASGATSDGEDASERSSGGREPAQATLLVGLAREEGVELFRDEQGEPFASFPVDGHRETWPLRSKTVRHYLARIFFLGRGRAPGSQALQDALQVLDGEARFAGEEHPVAVRLADHAGTLYLDLGDTGWRVVAISPAGWQILAPEACPVRFRRPRGLLPLPEPQRGGRITALRRLLNLAGEDDFRLVVGWLLGCLYPRGPRPVLQLLGEQGSAKSTQARLLRSLADPNAVPLRTQPRDEGDLLIAATNGAVVALDNLSELPRWLSDALCRLATGGGLSKRELYTDTDEILLDARCPVLLTAIGEVATASDLLDRCLTVTLPAIPPEGRRTEAEVDALAAGTRPQIFGALLDAAATGLANLPTTQLNRRPRLADFATWVEAAAPALGWEPGAFLDALEANRRGADAVAIEALPVGPVLLAFMETHDDWEGTATALLGELTRLASDEVRREREWPKRANRLATQLRRLAPNLRAVGLWVGWGREAGSGQRLVLLTKNRGAWNRHERHDRHRTTESGAGETGGSSHPSSPHRHGAGPARESSEGKSAACDGRDDGDGANASLFQSRLADADTTDDEAYEEFEL